MEEEKEKETPEKGEEKEEVPESAEETEAKTEEGTSEEIGEAIEKPEEVLEKPEEVEEPAEVDEEEVTALAEEEEAKPTREEKPEEEEIVEERFYTIPLGKAWVMPPKKRAPKAMRIIRGFVVKHMKLEKRVEGEEEEEAPKRLIINNGVNERVWGRGIEKPVRKIRVRAAKDKEGNVTIYLAEGE